MTAPLLERLGLRPLGVLAGGAALGGLMLLPFAGSYWNSVGLDFLMWVALVQSWLVFSAMTGYLSLGSAAFFGLGGYVMAVLWNKVPIALAMLAAGGASAALALLVGLTCLRVRGPYFVMLTFGIAEFTKHLTVNIEAAIDSFGRVLFGAPDVGVLYYCMLVLAVASFGACWAVRRSRWGVGMVALREDEVAAETIGVPVQRHKIAAFVLSAFIPGIVGAVMTMRAGSFEPGHGFDPMLSLTIICMAVIGGGDRPVAPLFGVLLLVGLSELLWSRFPQLYMVVVGALVIVFVLVVPGGLAGFFRAGADAKERAAAPAGEVVA